MPNEPNLGQSQIFIIPLYITSYSEKCKLDTWSKRTQTKPILPAIAGKFALSEAEGPVVMRNDFRIFRAQTILIYGKIGNFVTF